MKISIAMATYNGAKYLPDQLQSFCRQTNLPDELVVCDDGSSDETLSILNSFQEIAPFAVHVYHNDANLGYIKNFEKTLSLCTGEIIFLSDQDDVWFSTKIEKVISTFDEQPAVRVLINDMVITTELLEVTPFTQLGNLLSMGYTHEKHSFGCATALRRDFLSLILPIPEGLMGHDNWIHRLAIAFGVRDVYEEPLQYYRRHGRNESNCQSSKPVKFSEFDSFRKYGFKDASMGWANELARIKSCRVRLCERTEQLREIGLLDCQGPAIIELDCHIRFMEKRICNLKIKRPVRLFYVLVMFAQGGYRYFRGWRSVLKDILR